MPDFCERRNVSAICYADRDDGLHQAEVACAYERWPSTGTTATKRYTVSLW